MASSTPSFPLTIGDVAGLFGVRPWQVRRLYERGLLSPAARVGMYRVIHQEDLPSVESALRTAGYLSTDTAPDSASRREARP
jgi:hypothetical protein